MKLRGETQEVQAETAELVVGKIIELGQLNENGWGVKDADMELFKDIPVRACPDRMNKHACDEMGDMNSIIGRVIEAEEKAGWIWVKARITDSVAQRKIGEGTWLPRWSIFGTGQSMEDGFVKDFRPEAISLVEDPAYPEAEFEVAGAKWTTAYINELPDSAFAYVEPCYTRGDMQDKNARHLPYKDKNGNIDLPHLRNALARVSQLKPVCPDTDKMMMINKASKILQKAKKEVNMAEEEKKVETVVEAETEVKAEVEVEKLQAQIQELEAEVERLKAEEAEKERKIAESISAEKFEELKAEFQEQARKSVLEEIERKELLEAGIAAGLKTGVYTEETLAAEREKLQAKDIDELREQVKLLKMTAEKIEENENKFKMAELPADNSVNTTIGYYDASERKWYNKKPENR